MSSPYTSSRSEPLNIGILFRRPFQAIVMAIGERLEEAGFEAIRPAHQAVFQYVESEGTRVTVMAERAQMSKQSMAELVAHLERHGYVERVPDPADRRAKLVRLTERGRATVPVALGTIRDVATGWRQTIGEDRFASLVQALEALNRSL